MPGVSSGSAQSSVEDGCGASEAVGSRTSTPASTGGGGGMAANGFDIMGGRREGKKRKAGRFVFLWVLRCFQAVRHCLSLQEM